MKMEIGVDGVGRASIEPSRRSKVEGGVSGVLRLYLTEGERGSECGNGK